MKPSSLRAYEESHRNPSMKVLLQTARVFKLDAANLLREWIAWYKSMPTKDTAASYLERVIGGASEGERGQVEVPEVWGNPTDDTQDGDGK